MKQFHVYGLGNALVDLDFEVSENTLQRLNIEKGVMTLIDEALHHRLLEELDGVKHLKECGGSAANTICTLQQLGAKTFYSCKVGNDDAGLFYKDNLLAKGIQTNLQTSQMTGTTGKCIVLVTKDADRTMNTFLGVSADLSKEHLVESAIIHSRMVYIEGFLVASPSAKEAAILAREIAEKHQVKVAMSLSDPNMVKYFRQGLCDMIGNQVDILFCNEQEALMFAETESLAAAKDILKKYAKTFVITLGSQGALIYDGREFSRVASYKVNVLDTVGAGDVFAGTFLYAITHGFDYAEAGNVASFAAAKVVAKFGPRLDDREIADVKMKMTEEVCV